MARRAHRPQPVAPPVYGVTIPPPPVYIPPGPDFGLGQLQPDLAGMVPPPVSAPQFENPQLQQIPRPPWWQNALAQGLNVAPPQHGNGYNRSDFTPDLVAGLLRGLGLGAAQGIQRNAEAVTASNQGMVNAAAARNQANLKATMDAQTERDKIIEDLRRRQLNRQDRAAGVGVGSNRYLTAEDMYARAKAAAEGTAAGKANSTTVPGGQVKTPLTPEAIDMNARQLAATGKSGISVRDVESQRQVQNAAAKTYPGIDLAKNAATYNSNKNSLANLVKLNDGVQAFTETAHRNLAILVRSAQAIGGFDSPLANRPLRWFQQNANGSPQMAAYETARTTVAKEYARILTTLAGSGATTDAAQKELDKIVSGAYGLKQMYATLDVLNRDAENRGIAYANRIQEISGRTAAPAPDTSYTKVNGIRVRR